MTGSAKESPDHTLGRQTAPCQHRAAESAAGENAVGENAAGDRDLKLRIGADGTWYYRNSPIDRLPLVKLFASVLRREADGRYWLVTPVERGLVAVEDAPFVAVDCIASGSGQDQSLRFRTNLDEEVTAGTDHPIRVAENPENAEPRPYLLLRPGLEALIARSVFYRLAELAVPAPDDPERLGLWSEGQFFTLGRAA